MPNPQLFQKAVILRLPVRLHAKMQAHVASLAPQEACGLLGGVIEGDIYHAQGVYPVANALRSHVRYRMDPAEQLDAFQAIDAQGWEIVGIYHSHPNGPEHPSPTDIAEAYYPEAAYLIWNQREGEWVCRGFTIQNNTVDDVNLVILYQASSGKGAE